MEIPISFLIPLYANRLKQFEMSLNSLTRHNYNKSLIELLVFVDYNDGGEVCQMLRQYSKAFAKIRAYIAEKKRLRVSHSATRRNYLANKAYGDYIVFCEPEMFHVNNTIECLLLHTGEMNRKEWVCGPVYAADDMVNKEGKLVVDECKPIYKLEEVLALVNRKNFLNDSRFLETYHLIDYTYYTTPFFCAMFNRKEFWKLKGLNQQLKVRGYEEIEFYQRFAEAGGNIIVDETIKTIHLPHVRSLVKETQVAWNLYNSTVTFNKDQHFGEIDDVFVDEVAI